jgi:hypothetical protein
VVRDASGRTQKALQTLLLGILIGRDGHKPSGSRTD